MPILHKYIMLVEVTDKHACEQTIMLGAQKHESDGKRSTELKSEAGTDIRNEELQANLKSARSYFSEYISMK